MYRSFSELVNPSQPVNQTSISQSISQSITCTNITHSLFHLVMELKSNSPKKKTLIIQKLIQPPKKQ